MHTEGSRRKQWLTWLLWLMLGLPALSAQPDDRPTEAEIDIQRIFIEANREKLLQRYENAAQLYSEVLKRAPANATAWYELARLYDVLERYEKALEAATEATRLDPSNTWFRMFHGDVLARLERFAEAGSIYEALAEEHPDVEYYYFQWAFLLIKQERPEAAIKVYDKLEKLMGVNEELARKKHALYYGMRKYDKAERELQKLVATYPYVLDHQLLLADFYRDIGEESKAETAYKTVLKADPYNAEAQLALAQGRSYEGPLMYLRAIERIIADPAADLDAKIQQLFPFIQQFATLDAEVQAELLRLGKKLSDAHPDEPKALATQGDLYYQNKQLREALNCYKRTIALNSSVFSVWEQVMYIHVELGEMDELIAFTEEAMDLFPNQARVYYMNGLAWGEKGQHARAIEALEQGEMMARRNPELHYDILSRLGLEYAETGDFRQSDAAYGKALEVNPRSFVVLNNYSYSLAVRGERLELAKEMAIQANQLAANQPSFERTLALVMYKLGEYADAREWYERVLKNSSARNNGAILEEYGDTLFQLGRKDEAVRQWEDALQKAQGQNERLQKKIAERRLVE